MEVAAHRAGGVEGHGGHGDRRHCDGDGRHGEGDGGDTSEAGLVDEI